MEREFQLQFLRNVAKVLLNPEFDGIFGEDAHVVDEAEGNPSTGGGDGDSASSLAALKDDEIDQRLVDLVPRIDLAKALLRKAKLDATQSQGGE